MKFSVGIRFGLCGATSLFCSVLAQGQVAKTVESNKTAPLRIVQSSPVPGVSGDFDHFAVDLKGQRLFLVGEDHKTLEVLSLTTGKSVKSIKGFVTPHSVLYLPTRDQLLVIDGGDGTIKILRGTDYTVIGTIKVLEGADSIGYDWATGHLYVVTGGKDVPLAYSVFTAVDVAEKKTIGELRFENNHVEAMALEQNGPRVFINITDKNQVAVVDRNTMRVLKLWTVGVAQENSPIAFDEPNHRLFLVCRKPAMLVVLNSDTGEVVAHLPVAGRSDDVAFDQRNHRIYVPGGEGFISVVQQKDADHYELLPKVDTAPGAKTALLVPDLHKLFVAVSPGDTTALARVLTLEVNP